MEDKHKIWVVVISIILTGVMIITAILGGTEMRVRTSRKLRRRKDNQLELIDE